MTIVDSAFMLNYYLYGQGNAPVDLENGTLVRPGNETSLLTVTVQSYMAKVGRFALAAESALVADFFNASSIPVGSYSKTDMASLLGLSSYGIYIEQYQLDDGQGDYAERTLLWNSGAFKISDGAQFEVLADGTRRITNLSVEPIDTENFDTNSSSIPTQIANVLYLQNRLDPSNIGRKVVIKFSGTLNTRTYTESDFQTEQATISSWTMPNIFDAFSQISDLIS